MDMHAAPAAKTATPPESRRTGGRDPLKSKSPEGSDQSGQADKRASVEQPKTARTSPSKPGKHAKHAKHANARPRVSRGEPRERAKTARPMTHGSLCEYHGRRYICVTNGLVLYCAASRDTASRAVGPDAVGMAP